MKLSEKSSGGTSFHGHTITATYNQLVEVLGKPQQSQNDGSDKTNFDWTCETDEGIVFTVYDWKEYRRIKPNEKIDWHIGANTPTDSSQAFFELIEFI
jgi:hypothetical protein